MMPPKGFTGRSGISGEKEGGSGDIMQALLAMLLSERFTQANNGDGHPRSDVAEKLLGDIRKSMTDKKEQ